MDLSIIILTWNSLDLLKTCVQSIEYTTISRNREIIIVDNNSADGTREFLKSMHTKGLCRLILNRRNRGVAPSRNQAIKIAQGQYILLLDVDTIASPHAIDTLAQYLDNTPRCGVVAPKLTNIDGDLEFTCRKYPTVASKLLRRIPSKWARKLLADEEMHDWNHASVKEVDYVIGACQLIRKSVIGEVGLLDEHIFYGPEDIDFCLRVWQAGYKVVYNPEAVVIHDERRITKRDLFSKMTWEHAKGMAYFFAKHKYILSRRSLYKAIPKVPST